MKEMTVHGFDVRINAHNNRTIDEVEIMGPKRCEAAQAWKIIEYLQAEGCVSSSRVGMINYAGILPPAEGN